MALNDTTISKSSFKLLQGKAHTSNAFDLPNEAESSAPTIAAQELFGESIPFLPADAVTQGIAVSQTLTLVLDPNSAGKAYFAVISTVAGSNLDGHINPRTGVAYVDGDRVGYFIPPKFDAPAETNPSSSYRAILRDSGTEIAPTDARNWYFDYRAGIVTSETNLSLTAGTIEGYVYIGDYVDDQIAFLYTKPDGYFDPFIVEAGRIDIKNRNNGRVGIGDASSQFPDTLLHVAGNEAAGVFATIQNEDVAAGSLSGLLFKSGNVDDTTKSGVLFERGGTNGYGKLHLANSNTALVGDVSLSDAVLTIDHGKRIGINNTSPSYTIDALSDSSIILNLNTYNNSANGPYILSRYARGTSSSPATVENNDQLLGIYAYAYDGSFHRFAASIEAEMDGFVSSNDVPTRFVFRTTPDGGNFATERVRITNQGHVGINTTTTTAHRLHVRETNLASGSNVAKLEATAGSIGTVEGLVVDMSYTSGSPTIRGAEVNVTGVTSGTGTGLRVYSDSRSGSSLISSMGFGPVGNRAIEVWKSSASSASNDSAGIYSYVAGSRYNFGVIADATSSSNSPTLNVGLWGGASGGASNIGVYASVGTSGSDQEINLSSGALVANNEASTLPIILGLDNDIGVFVVADGGDVGIGTTSPEYNLHIKNNDVASGGDLTLELNDFSIVTGDVLGTILFKGAHSTAPGARIWAAADANWGGGNVSGTKLYFGVGDNGAGDPSATPDLSLDSTGLGIFTGSDEPEASLEVRDSQSLIAVFKQAATLGADAGIKIRGSRNNTLRGDTAYIDFANYDDGSDNAAAPIDYTTARISGGMDSATTQAGVMTFSTNSGSGPTSKMTLNSSGFLGIGTDVPDSHLHLSGLGGVKLRIDADTNNAGGENQNPGIILTQDGRNIAVVFGIVGVSGTGPFGETITGSIANYPIIYGIDGDGGSPFARGLQFGVGNSGAGTSKVVMTLDANDLVTITDSGTNLLVVPSGMISPQRGYQLVSNDTQGSVDWDSPVSGARSVSFYDDFIFYPSVGWLEVLGGAGAGISNTLTGVDDDHTGVILLQTGTTSTGRAMLRSNTGATRIQGGRTTFEAAVRLDTLSSSTDEYTFRIGLGDDTSGNGDYTDGVYFEYDRTIGPNWRAVTANGGSRTRNVTSAVVGASTWTHLRFEATTSSVTFWINGTAVTTIFTNIPTTAGTGLSIQMAKSTGTNSRVARVDYYSYHKSVNRTQR